ncbi:MAG TPA: hypothetical protein VER33_01215 [Polyangiaceae bacterium]|nr:hypothetical protein [Polyangiaceae bacterium]
MSRRAKKQQSDRAPVSGTRVSNKSRSQRKQQRRKAKPVLALVQIPATSSAPSPVAAASSLPAVKSLAPAQVAESWRPLAANEGAERSVAEALPDVELSFFDGGSALAPSVAPAAASEPVQSLTDDVDSLLLTPEQQQRRQWFRRQVTTLMAGMGALGTVAIVARIASLL